MAPFCVRIRLVVGFRLPVDVCVGLLGVRCLSPSDAGILNKRRLTEDEWLDCDPSVFSLLRCVGSSVKKQKTKT